VAVSEREREAAMSHKTYLLTCGALFSIIAAAHLTRLIAGWDMTLAGWTAPRWISIPGTIVPALLSAWGFVLASRQVRADREKHHG
jgi:hypothetical protein